MQPSQPCLAAHPFLLGVGQEFVVNVVDSWSFTDIEHTRLFLLSDFYS